MCSSCQRTTLTSPVSTFRCTSGQPAIPHLPNSSFIQDHPSLRRSSKGPVCGTRYSVPITMARSAMAESPELFVLKSHTTLPSSLTFFSRMIAPSRRLLPSASENMPFRDPISGDFRRINYSIIVRHSILAGQCQFFLAFSPVCCPG
jgi:hypothetical protein